MARAIIKALYYQFYIANCVLSQETFFHELETRLRAQEVQIIADILYEADKVPQPECLKLLQEIEKVRNHIKQTLLKNPDAKYLWTPREDTVTPVMLKNHNTFTLGQLALYTAEYANMLNIKPGLIKTAYQYAQKNNYILAYVKSKDIEKNSYKIHFYVDFMNEQNKIFPQLSITILHELTHIIEGHPLIKYLIISTINQYYSSAPLPNNLIQLIDALTHVHETIADVVPLMYSPTISAIQKILQYACNIRVLTMGKHYPHLTVAQCARYNAKIYTHHEDTSVKKLLYILNQMPELKKTIRNLSLSVGINVGIGLVFAKIV